MKRVQYLLALPGRLFIRSFQVLAREGPAAFYRAAVRKLDLLGSHIRTTFGKHTSIQLPSAPPVHSDLEPLLTIQNRFRMYTNMLLVRDRRSVPRQFCVYFQCGSGSLHSQWFTNGPRSWDFIVNHYEDTYLDKIPCDLEFRQAGPLPGTKFTSFFTILTKWFHLIANYDYLFLLDDDILIREPDIDRLFEIVQTHSLDLAQPSLSPDSFFDHPVYEHSGTPGPRYVNTVEIMMPVLSQRALRVGAHLFGQTVSGWGLDLALGKLVNDQLGDRIAVIDDIVARHTKPISTTTGSFYKMLIGAMVYPEQELALLKQMYGFESRFYETYGPGVHTERSG